MLVYRDTQTLTNENISMLVEASVEAYKQAAKKRASDTVRLALSVEEILLNYRDHYGTDNPCTLIVQKSLGKIIFEFHQKGPQDNPIASEDEEDVTVAILGMLDMAPKYTYRERTRDNEVSFVAAQKARKNQMIIEILIAVALAFICHELIGLLPMATQTSIAEGLVAPLFNKSMAIITTIATPLVFFGILNGIIEIGDVRSLGAIGKTFLGNMGGTYLFSGIVFSVLGIIVYGVDLGYSGTGEGGYLAQTVKLVLDIFPDHLLEAFTIDNDLQVVVVAVLIGVAVLGLRGKSESIKDALTTIGDVVNQMMMIVLKILPFIVFIGVLNILCSNMKGLGKVYMVCVLFIITSIVVVAYMLFRVKRAFNVPIKVLFDKQLATTMINLTTSSQVSALPENVKCCKNKFGIDEKLVNFGLPLGIVVYMPNGACFFGVTVWSLSQLAGMPMGIFQMIVVMLMSCIVAIAAPPIPGSAITVLPILLSVVVLPNAMFPIAVLLATFLGYFLPLLNGYCLQLELLLTAKKLNMVDEEVLRKPMK